MKTCYRDRQRETLRRTDEQSWTTLCMGDYDVRGLQEKTLYLLVCAEIRGIQTNT